MKVLHVIETLGRGGAEQALVNLLPALKQNHVDCHVAVLCPPYDLASELQGRGITVHFLNMNHQWNMIQGIIKITRLYYSHKYDVLHAHMFFSGLYVALSKFFAWSPRRVVSFHNLDYDSYPANTLWKKFRKYLDQVCMCHLIDAGSAVSPQVKEHYECHLKVQDLRVIPNSIPTPVIANVIESKELREFIQENDIFTFVMPGRLVHEKGHRYAIEAMGIIQAKGLRVRLLIIGSGPIFADLKQQVAGLIASNSVLIHEVVPQNQLFSIIDKLDACLFTSTHEGWGLAAAESMAIGKPVIATKVGGYLEVINDKVSGLLVPPASPACLAKAMLRLVNDKQLCVQLAEAGKESIEMRFNPSLVAKNWFIFYQKVLGKK